MVAECVRKYLKDKMDQKILDVAAGSGKVGAEVSNYQIPRKKVMGYTWFSFCYGETVENSSHMQ